MEIECVSDKENVGRPVKEMYRDNFYNIIINEEKCLFRYSLNVMLLQLDQSDQLDGSCCSGHETPIL